MGKGLIFISDSLADLQNSLTTQKFSSFTKTDFINWAKWRQNALKGVSLNPWEPVGYFDLEAKT